MSDVKNFLRHELLNILTILNLSIGKQKFTRQDKDKAQELIQLAGVLISNEDLFGGAKPDFFRQEILLQDTLETVILLSEDQIQQHNVDVVVPHINVTLQFDRYYVSESLGHIIRKLLPLTSHIEFSFDEKRSVLTIHHDADWELLAQKDFSTCLTKKDLHSGEILYQLSLYILQVHSAPPIISKGNLSIPLGQKK